MLHAHLYKPAPGENYIFKINLNTLQTHYFWYLGIIYNYNIVTFHHLPSLTSVSLLFHLFHTSWLFFLNPLRQTDKKSEQISYHQFYRHTFETKPWISKWFVTAQHLSTGNSKAKCYTNNASQTRSRNLQNFQAYWYFPLIISINTTQCSTITLVAA